MIDKPRNNARIKPIEMQNEDDEVFSKNVNN